MATVDASRVYKLLGSMGLAIDDYHTAKMPAGEPGTAGRAACLAAARRRPHRRAEHEVLHRVGRQVHRAYATIVAADAA